MTDFAPKRKKLLTRPVLKYVVDKPIYVKIEKEMHIGKEMKAAAGEKKKDPATLCDVIDLTNGEPAQLILNAVVKSVLTEEYPDAKYVGLCFAITKQARVQGKSYDPFSIEEIEDPAADTTTVDSGDAAKPAPVAAAKPAAHDGNRRR
jgi:hypothetical protein